MPELSPWLEVAVAVVAAIVTAVVITAIAALALRLAGRRKAWPVALVRRVRIPFRIALTVALVWAAVEITLPDGEWRFLVTLAFRVAFIVSVAWLLAAAAFFLEDLGLGRFRLDVPDNLVARRMQTQVALLRRLTVVVVVILALGAILLSFPGVEALGASILASAGLLSIVAGLAAQSSLANVFAGIQLAFSDAIRIDDVVVVEQEWGRIEEITLTYIVVHLWDDRRLVLPSTWFTTNPFQNWTRRTSELLGAVEFDLDWSVSPDRIRGELNRILADTDLWDGRVSVLQVTDAVGGYVRVRVLVTAVDAPTLFDLRCLVREEIVAWLTRESPESVPHDRVQLTRPDDAADRHPVTAQPEPVAGTGTAARGGAGLFTGGEDAKARAGHFTGAISLPGEERDDGRAGPGV